MEREREGEREKQRSEEGERDREFKNEACWERIITIKSCYGIMSDHSIIITACG